MRFLLILMLIAFTGYSQEKTSIKDRLKKLREKKAQYEKKAIEKAREDRKKREEEARLKEREHITAKRDDVVIAEGLKVARLKLSTKITDQTGLSILKFVKRLNPYNKDTKELEEDVEKVFELRKKTYESKEKDAEFIKKIEAGMDPDSPLFYGIDFEPEKGVDEITIIKLLLTVGDSYQELEDTREAYLFYHMAQVISPDNGLVAERLEKLDPDGALLLEMKMEPMPKKKYLHVKVREKVNVKKMKDVKNALYERDLERRKANNRKIDPELKKFKGRKD